MFGVEARRKLHCYNSKGPIPPAFPSAVSTFLQRQASPLIDKVFNTKIICKTDPLSSKDDLVELISVLRWAWQPAPLKHDLVRLSCSRADRLGRPRRSGAAWRRAGLAAVSAGIARAAGETRSPLAHDVEE